MKCNSNTTKPLANEVRSYVSSIGAGLTLAVLACGAATAAEAPSTGATRAGLHAIPAVVRELNEVEVLEIAIVENVQRRDLNPIEEAQGFQALIDRFGRTQQEIAEAVGKSRPHIANMLRLPQLPEDLEEMVRDGRLSSGHARAILTAPDPRGLAQRALTEGLNVREIERLAQQAKPKDRRLAGLILDAQTAQKDWGKALASFWRERIPPRVPCKRPAST